MVLMYRFQNSSDNIKEIFVPIRWANHCFYVFLASLWSQFLQRDHTQEVFAKPFSRLTYQPSNAKDILIEEPQWNYPPYPWGNEGVHAFHKSISSKVSAIERLDFELAYFGLTVQHFSHHTTGTPQDTIDNVRLFRLMAYQPLMVI